MSDLANLLVAIEPQLDMCRLAEPEPEAGGGGGNAGCAGALEDVKKLSTDQGSSRMAAELQCDCDW